MVSRPVPRCRNGLSGADGPPERPRGFVGAQGGGEALRRTDMRQAVVLAAGGGGPMGIVAEELEKKGLRVEATLCDLYPNLDKPRAVAGASAGKLRVEETPVDAAAIPARLGGLRLLFNSFHLLIGQWPKVSCRPRSGMVSLSPSLRL